MLKVDPANESSAAAPDPNVEAGSRLKPRAATPWNLLKSRGATPFRWALLVALPFFGGDWGGVCALDAALISFYRF